MWDWRFLGLLLLSTVVDYSVGRLLARSDAAGRRASLLVLSMLVNLGILGVFKYANFFADSLASLLADSGLAPNEPFLRVVLPVGISFYTFQTMSYTVTVIMVARDIERIAIGDSARRAGEAIPV
jgi:D-alanyl-lipoteichoic acid acyltransferase DltB (MBOAT superfamily)